MDLPAPKARRVINRRLLKEVVVAKVVQVVQEREVVV
jgi:hypothetical protein